MVVVPNSRTATSSKQDGYLDQSIQLKGVDNTMVVMNKADVSEPFALCGIVH